MKKIVLGSLLIFGLSTGLAFGQTDSPATHGKHMMGGDSKPAMMDGMMKGGMMKGGMMMNAGTEKGCLKMRGASDSTLEKNLEYMTETKELRKKLHDLHFDIAEARNQPETTQGTLMDMEKEMSGIHTQIAEIGKKYKQNQSAQPEQPAQDNQHQH